MAHGVTGLLLELMLLIKVEAERKELPSLSLLGGGGGFVEVGKWVVMVVLKL